MISYRRMKLSEQERIAEVDRSEHVTQAYRQSGADLDLVEVEWAIPQTNRA